MIYTVQRNHNLDAFRGLAILLMVLSSSIAFGVLPAWMYHGQVPPPDHIFNPDLPGITWVDLVFPFFLFSMGAAIPLALQKKLAAHSAWSIAWHIVQRYALLVLFALFTFYARASVMSNAAGWREYCISIGCFVLLFLMYTRFEKLKEEKLGWVLKVVSFALAIGFLLTYPFAKNGFDLASSDIIIIVLANMSLFGAVIWCFTRKHPLLRIGVLPFIMAVLLVSKDANSWNSILFNWSPFPWMYKFYYLKYLFIVLPGTFAGEWLLHRAGRQDGHVVPAEKKAGVCIALLSLLLLGVNVTCLYLRLLVPNLLVTMALSAGILLLIERTGESSDRMLLKKLASAGVYLLMLGLFFEAFEGGIKKDISTFSYYFVCTGLAFLAMLSLTIFEKYGYFSGAVRYLGDNGKNPMIAYTAGNLCLIPLLKITGMDVWLDALTNLPAGGFLRGLVFTGIVSLITIYCTRAKLLWRT